MGRNDVKSVIGAAIFQHSQALQFFPRQSFIELNFVDQGEAQLAEEQKVTFDFKMLHFVIASIEWMMCVKSIQNFMHIFILMHN